MNDEAYLRVESALRVQAAEIHAEALSDDTIAEGVLMEDGLRRPFTPKERVLIRLEALYRHLSLIDHSMYGKAMGSIQDTLISSSPRADGRPTLPEGANVVTIVPGQAGETTTHCPSYPTWGQSLRN